MRIGYQTGTRFWARDKPNGNWLPDENWVSVGVSQMGIDYQTRIRCEEDRSNENLLPDGNWV